VVEDVVRFVPSTRLMEHSVAPVIDVLSRSGVKQKQTDDASSIPQRELLTQPRSV
jgi:hypothetical protein